MNQTTPRVAKRSAVQLQTFITRLHKAGTPPAEVRLHPDGTLVAVFSSDAHPEADLEKRMGAMMG